MKAPDKIYIQTNAGETISSKWTTIPFRDFENTEYIRKDVLINWLKEHINDYLVHGRDIDLMFEDLRKSMEEEK